MELDEEKKFFIYLLEHYAAYKNKATAQVLSEWDGKKITQKVYDNYWLYQTEAMENAYKDIDAMLQ